MASTDTEWKETAAPADLLPILPPGEKLPPLNAPADIWQLLGRFFGSLILACITITHIIRQDWVSSVAFGFLSLMLQMGAIILYQRLRKERREAETALRTRYGDGNTEEEAAVSS